MPEFSHVSCLPPPTEVAPFVENMLRAAALERAQLYERRWEARQPYARLISVVPVDKLSCEPTDEPIAVVGKELSPGGFGFFHQQPIPFRHLLMQACPMDEETWLLLRIRWCRFLQPGWYESGGQFIKPIELGSAQQKSRF